MIQGFGGFLSIHLESGESGPRGRVIRLPDALVDQIAAGEVVERPASVVKELLENALDAEASRVRIEVREGGRAFLAVTDDGVGMAPEDARLALERHATSKIARAEDLQRIGTFGFRGEALPSIAAVSTLRLRTRARGRPSAFLLRVESGQVQEAREAAGPEGTRVEVADLFAAVPARRKFLKTAATEWRRIADGLARAALALPHVHFDVRRDDRPAFTWPATREPLDRIAAVLGEDAARSLLDVAAEEGGLGVRGFASRPDRHRPTLSGVHWYVNGRPVRDRLLQHALLDAYRDVLPRGRFPTAVLYLQIPVADLDVNVHPAKWEVRFREAPAVHRLIRRAVRDAIAGRAWLAGAPARRAGPGDGVPRAWAAGAGRAGPTGQGGRGRAAEAAPGGDADPTGDWLFAPAGRPPEAAGASAEAPGAPGDAPLRFGDLRLVGQLLATYLLVEAKEGLLLVDQHAAHERVLYERLRAELRERGVARQGLLQPLPVELAPAEAAALAEGAEAALRLGFELEPFGAETWAVRAVPALLADRDPAGLVRGLAEELAASPSAEAGLPDADRVFASLACHAARRKGDALDPREQRALLDALDAIPWAPTCPHGRPVAVPFEVGEIERRFGRR